MENSRSEWFIRWIIPVGLGLIVSYQQTQMQDQKQVAKDLEQKVFVLATEKVSKSELKDTEDRLTRNIDALKTDMIASNNIMKTDILQQISLLRSSLERRN